MSKKYWQNFGDLTESERFQQDKEKEFKEELLPIEELQEESLLSSKTPRRDFLKYLGFSTAAAAIAAGCEMPVRKAVPYLNKPEELIPGVSDYYASTFVNGGDAVSVIVKQRDGRPIKLEGNESCPLTGGGTSAIVQASVLDLYDPTRLRHPMEKSGNSYKEIPSFDQLDARLAGEIAASGKPLVLLTSTINSPTTLEIIAGFLAKYPGSRHVQYDAVSHSGMLLANEASYGRKALPRYQFAEAKAIVSLGADFLGTWLNSIEYTKDYAAGRNIKGSSNPEMSRHLQFESMMSLTGSNADDRYTHKPSETGMVAMAILAGLGGGTAPAIKDATLAKGVKDAVTLLNANKGKALVVCGSNDSNVQIVVNAINEAVGANGTTINWGASTNTRRGVDSEMVLLAQQMNAGAIGTLLVYDCNPVYNYADGANLAKAIAKVPVTVSFNRLLDETAEYCKYIIPTPHWLESWGDAEPVSGFISLIQPLINPLFKTRPFQTTLLKWSGAVAAPVAIASAKDSASQLVPPAMMGNQQEDPYAVYVQNYWKSKLGGDNNWNKALQEGTIQAAGTVLTGASHSAGALSTAAAKIAAVKAGETEVVLYQKISMGDGSMANNPWLQEVPDPITKVTWDNYAIMSPTLAKAVLGIDVANNQRQADAYEVTPEKPVVKITGANKQTISLPVLIIPGINDHTIAVALGYGRQSADDKNSLERVGKAATNAGKNAYPLAFFDGTSTIYSSAVSVEKTGDVYPLAQTQVHGFTEGRPIVHETSLAQFVANPKAMLAEVNEERELLIPHGKESFEKDATLYPYYDKPGIKWGMSIDLNTCIGCSACVVACTAENNVSVVGKIQVQRAHEMHWLRIDRYFTGDLENPDVIFQPMLCQHCDNAPCENVCPVAATPHSSEGLNQMTYNRCIGTRYCANNCPYKVRRFNWHDYTGADSFADNQEPLRGTDLDEAVFQMNDELSRMVLNPDVTVRSRGVMEKCSFCVQRLQEAKLEAKKQQDPTMIRNVKTACSQACPTNAITFGNVNDKESEVVVAREDEHRNFYVLEQLHVLPNVSYLAKVRNSDRVIGEEHEHVQQPHGEQVSEGDHG